MYINYNGACMTAPIWEWHLPLGGTQFAPCVNIFGLSFEGGEPFGTAVIDSGKVALVVLWQHGGIEELVQRFHVTAVEVHLMRQKEE